MSLLANSVGRFENKHRHGPASTADEVGSWFSHGHDGGHQVVPLDSPKSGGSVVLSSASFPGIKTTIADWGFSTEGTTLVDQQLYCLALPLSGSCMVFDTHFGKIECHKKRGRIIRRNAGTKVVASAGNKMIYLAIPADRLEARARSLFNCELDDSLRFSPGIDLDTHRGGIILSLFSYLLTLHGNSEQAFEHEIVNASFFDYLTTCILSTLPHNYSFGPDASIEYAIPGVVRRAEDWLQAHAHEPVSMEILAREVGCSERALQNAFRNFRDKSPMTVLRDIRLDRAHSDLKLAQATVTDVALKWGFSNLGRFAAQYEAKFHEKPSQTVGRNSS
ncbi:helix-turn-helix transcriptional regulator [Hoeflea poritis]|uniref:Helix-turn-helix transcriptional regulator n=1 Tax=Hoeflea poritis TaxID=2993659 RepID=A0ABT4VV22_9HYPH|nr:helix-turn-helix transcriptional regulator [Hoeflea poritis]MDA4848554.1 helix-turn-helix transcriptional regulator [Hoeflea poritis]